MRIGYDISIIYSPIFDRCFHSCVITRCSSIFNFRSLSRGTIYIEQANLSLFLSFSLRLCQPDLSFAGFSKFTVIHKVIFRLSNYRDMLLPSPKVNDISRSNVFLLLPARINVPRVLQRNHAKQRSGYKLNPSVFHNVISRWFHFSNLAVHAQMSR